LWYNIWNISRNGYRSQLTRNLEKLQREKEHKIVKFSNGSEEVVEWDGILIPWVVLVCSAGNFTTLDFNTIWNRNKMSVRIETCHLVRKYLSSTWNYLPELCLKKIWIGEGRDDDNERFYAAWNYRDVRNKHFENLRLSCI